MSAEQGGMLGDPADGGGIPGLTQDELVQLRKMFSSPMDIPQEWKSWLVSYLEANPPVLPISQVFGYTQVYRVLERSTSTADVQNSAAEGSLYSAVIKGGDMSTDRKLTLSIAGDMLYNRGGSDTITLRIKFGGTTFFADTTDNGGVGASASRVPWLIHLDVANQNATDSQYISGFSGIWRPTSTIPATGLGGITFAGGALNPFSSNGLGSIDTSVDQTLEITAQWGVASVQNSFRKRYAFLSLV